MTGLLDNGTSLRMLGVVLLVILLLLVKLFENHLSVCAILDLQAIAPKSNHLLN